MDQRVSNAQFEDFPTRGGRKASSSAHASSLGSGLMVTEDSLPQPHHLNRQRIAHDLADMHPDTFTSLHDTHMTAPCTSSAFQTTYQCMAAASEEQKTTSRKTGKKIFQPAVTSGAPRLPMGVASFVGGGTLADRRDEGLQAGTTKTSAHMPGELLCHTVIPSAMVTHRLCCLNLQGLNFNFRFHQKPCYFPPLSCATKVPTSVIGRYN